MRSRSSAGSLAQERITQGRLSRLSDFKFKNIVESRTFQARATELSRSNSNTREKAKLIPTQVDMLNPTPVLRGPGNLTFE